MENIKKTKKKDVKTKQTSFPTSRRMIVDNVPVEVKHFRDEKGALHVSVENIES
jgi:hypothetical protein